MSVVSIDSRGCACSGIVSRSVTASLVGEILSEMVVQAGKWRAEAKVPRPQGVREGWPMHAVISRLQMTWTGLVQSSPQMLLVGVASADGTTPKLDRNFHSHSEEP